MRRVFQLLAFCSAAAGFGLTPACDRLPSMDGLSSTLSGTPAEPSKETLLQTAINSAHRTEAEKARDAWRRPLETLAFFGVEPQMTVMEVWPGGGWYTNILAPYLATGDGVLYAAHFDPTLSPAAATAIADYKARYTADKQSFGDVRVTAFNPADAAQASVPANSVDAVLTFRNVHNWLEGAAAETAFKEFFQALKPGGVLGVVEHRADPSTGDGESHGGYVTEASVIALAQEAGFVLEAASDINANPADTKDHPFGVWTLRPVRRSADAPGKRAADFPRAQYDAIGESDRMTLRFRKPSAADSSALTAR
ncbi:MAG: methyltransferase domain-containing protein [Pseudomonadota bacterium]